MEDARDRRGGKRRRQRLDHIMLDELEASAAQQMLDIADAPGLQVVEADHARAARSQPVAQMRADKSCSARHERERLDVEQCQLPRPYVTKRFRTGCVPNAVERIGLPP